MLIKYNSYIDMKTIDFTDNELNILVQLLDIAVKAQGLNVAEAAVVLARKLSSLTRQSKTEKFLSLQLSPLKREKKKGE